MTAQFCGACGANIQQPGQSTLHPALDGAYILCGASGKRVLTYTTVEDIPAQPRPTTAAHEALAALIRALEYHDEMESTPCEVHSFDGWKDVMDLAVDIGKALDR